MMTTKADAIKHHLTALRELGVDQPDPGHDGAAAAGAEAVTGRHDHAWPGTFSRGV